MPAAATPQMSVASTTSTGRGAGEVEDQHHVAAGRGVGGEAAVVGDGDGARVVAGAALDAFGLGGEELEGVGAGAVDGEERRGLELGALPLEGGGEGAVAAGGEVADREQAVLGGEAEDVEDARRSRRRRRRGEETMVARLSSARPEVGSVSMPPFATARRRPSGIRRTSWGPAPPVSTSPMRL